jgi:hypothetical protein
VQKSRSQKSRSAKVQKTEEQKFRSQKCKSPEVRRAEAPEVRSAKSKSIKVRRAAAENGAEDSRVQGCKDSRGRGG